MSESDLRAARKAWRNRNSAFHDAWPPGTQTNSPPAFTEETSAMPEPDSGRIDADERTEEGEAVRHVHEYSVEDPDA